MRQRINTRFANCLLAIGLSGLAPVAAQAQAANDKWQWELGIYGWFPAIETTTSFPSGASTTIDVSARDVIDSLKMAFMGQIEARKGRWGVWSDLVYSDVGGSKDGSRNFTVGGNPVNSSANLGLDVKSTVWSLAGIYNLTSTPENTTDLLFGARMLNMKQTLNWSLASSVPELPTRSDSVPPWMTAARGPSTDTTVMGDSARVSTPAPSPSASGSSSITTRAAISATAAVPAGPRCAIRAP